MASTDIHISLLALLVCLQVLISKIGKILISIKEFLRQPLHSLFEIHEELLIFYDVVESQLESVKSNIQKLKLKLEIDLILCKHLSTCLLL